MAEVLEKVMVQHCQEIYSSNLTNFIHGKDCIKDYSCFLSCENGVKLPKEASSLDTNCDWMNYFSKGKDTLPDMEKIYVTSEASQVELVTSPVLWECLQVIKADSNFSDLSYRASHDLNNQEVLVVYREKVTRVFALPVEPISLTLEPNGKCLLSIPFKPALRVTVANSSSGEVDRKALVALLQMVSGKGYSFCPGIPPKLLMGKACGKYVILHRIPFKRYNAQGCPVYFQSQAAKVAHNKSNLRALCPRCLQISRWVQTLPFIRALNPALALHQSALTMKTPLSDATKQQNARNSAAVDSTSNDCIVIAVEKAETKTITSGSGGSQRMTPTSPASAVGPNLEVPQSSFLSATISKGPIADAKLNDVNVKLQSVSESLRQLIHARTKNRQTNSLIGEGHCKMPEDGSKDRKGKNVCKLCQKQFSTNLRLSKHVQRHEGSTRNIKPLHGRKAVNAKFSDAVLKRCLRGSRFLTKNGKKGQGDISQTSLRMLLKCLDNVMEGRVTEQPVETDETSKRRKRKREPADEGLSPQDGKISKVIKMNKMSQDTLETEKSDVGFSALLAAAGIASTQSHPGGASSGSLYTSSSVPSIIDKELVTYDSSMRDEDSSGAERKARKSPRLASKRAKASTKRTTDRKERSGEEGTVEHQHTDDSLTNLDLLSTVSVQAAAVAVLKPMINNSTVGASSTSRISQTSTLPFSTSHSGLNASPLPPTQKFSSNTAPSLPPELIRVTPEKKPNTLPAIPPLTYVPQEEQHLLYPKSGAAASSFSPRPNPVVSSPTEKVAPGHNIPMHLFEKDVSLSSSSISTETSHIVSAQHLTSGKSDCGAMDLSKRKVPIPSCKVLGMTSQANPPPGADSNKNAAEVIRRLLMINPQEPAMTPTNRDPPSPRALTSNKEADENLQARIFASAKDYKVDSLKQSAGQVQTVVAPFSGPPSNLKQGKPLSTEIQCGYKWSGSGGLVKERTQMVKELVPSVVISDILSKPSGASSQRDDHSISATVTGVAKVKSPFGSSFSRLYEPSELAASSTLSTKTLEPPAEPSVQNSAVSCALNLSKSRSESETHGRLTVLPSTLLSLSSIVTTTAAVGTSLRSLRGQTTVVSSPSSPLPNVFRNSFRHPSARLEQLPTSLSQSNKDSNSTSSTRVLSLPIPVMPVSPISSASSPAPQSISSPSLAAILRQPPNPRVNPNSSGNGNTQAVSVPTNSLDTLNTWRAGPGGQDKIQIKREPVDPELDVSETTVRNFSGIVVKMEHSDTSGSVYGSDYGISKAISPGNVVVDMSSDRLSVSSVESESNLSVSPFGGLKIRPTLRQAKCEYCSQLLSSPMDSSSHVCPGFKS